VNGLEARVSPIPPAADLEERWRELEARVTPGAFLGWLWVGSWLECYAPRGVLIEVHDAGGRTAALGLFAVAGRQGLLHQTGDEARDQIWIEYNGLLADDNARWDALATAVRALLRETPCREAHLSMLPATLGEALRDALRHVRVYQEVTGWERDLAALRRQGRSVLEGLSSNTRQQVRRSIRGYQARDGGLSVRRAETLDEALEAWELAGEWHRARWQDSGFANPEFARFHTLLLKRGFDHGAVRLYRVAFGTETIAVCHFLCDGGTARFYLQGVRPEADGRLKPGLTAHSVLMQQFLDEGWDSYDFMGGDSQYKRQLADRRTRFLTLRVHDGSVGHRLRDVARGLRARIQGRADAR